jgi:hypothetical protein
VETSEADDGGTSRCFASYEYKRFCFLDQHDELSRGQLLLTKSALALGARKYDLQKPKSDLN